MLRQVRGHRHPLVLVTGAFILWLLISRFYHGLSSSEFSKLQLHMNGGEPPIPITLRPSSFNWSSVPFQFPPGELTPLPTGRSRRLPPVQGRFLAETYAHGQVREARRRRVRDIFLGDWNAYKKYAWMRDALMPMSGGFRDQFSGWAATLVDSLDTLWILGLRDEFDEAVAAVVGIDFGHSSSGRVNTFETNIRYLGGLLAAYDLSKREVLRAKAVELGDLIYAAFNTENRMPVDFIDFERAKTGEGLIVENSVVSASPGTLSLEMTRLSQITGDPKYYDAISKITDVFYQGQNETMLPGMWPMMVSMSSKQVTWGNQFTLAGCADSLYEYLPKAFALLGGKEPKYEIMSKGFMETAKNNLLFRPMIPGNESVLIASGAHVANDGEVILDEETEHLACYLGGLYALGGKLFNNQEYVQTGAKLTLGCVYGYRSFPTGIMPERLNMVACTSMEDCEWDEERFNKEKLKRPEWKDHLPLGFTTAKDPRYILRPEAIESVFIMYRITGNPAWQDLGWDMFTAVVNGTKTKRGTHAAVKDVTRANVLSHEDYMESFWLAETLKYFYLLFCPPDIISLDDYVLNTEAHPFLRPR
ncbi:endoplasmic reticulum mannosyl-oligosaccharide 1,2-alpha-mannosidase [Xylariaceae sp. FL0662B]|nr:endoplasmic reticulum mannosyl-oligosaccharide 1,2-alpha-mannosidase [Xylariaceae sp. FL0662B]